VTITKQQQLEQRRHAVLELSAQGLSQQEIANKLLMSQKTVSNDLTFLKKDAVVFVQQNRANVAFEYKQIMCNFYQLRKEAWNHFHSTDSENVKTNLYGIIESINTNIMDLLAAGDMIELEILDNSKEQAASIKEDMNQAIDSTSTLSNQAQF
jgi:DNA-binding transcriptional regulator LsrR (DeoR family)